jgi:hypothetical protein
MEGKRRWLPAPRVEFLSNSPKVTASIGFRASRYVQPKSSTCSTTNPDKAAAFSGVGREKVRSQFRFPRLARDELKLITDLISSGGGLRDQWIMVHGTRVAHRTMRVFV